MDEDENEHKLVNIVAEFIKDNVKSVEEVTSATFRSRLLARKVANKFKINTELARTKLEKLPVVLINKVKILLSGQKNEKANQERSPTCDQEMNVITSAVDQNTATLDDQNDIYIESFVQKCESVNVQSLITKNDLAKSDLCGTAYCESKKSDLNDVDTNGQFDMVTDGEKCYRITNVKGDGNCLFRSWSQFLYNHEGKYKDLRKQTVEYVVRNFISEFDALFMSNATREYKDAVEYDNVMSKDGEYATLFEVGILRKIFNTNVRVFISAEKNHIQKVDEYHDPAIKSPSCNLLILGKKVGGREIEEGHWVVLSEVQNFRQNLAVDQVLNEDLVSVDRDSIVNSKQISKTERECTKGNTLVERQDKNSYSEEYDLPEKENEEFLDMCQEIEDFAQKSKKSKSGKVDKNKTVYDHDLGNILVPMSYFQEAVGYNENARIKRVLEDCILYDLNCTCMVRFYGGIHRNIADITAWAHCGFETTISTQLYKPLKGEERDLFVEGSKSEGVQKFMNNIIVKSDRGIKCDGHPQQMRRCTVLYTAKSEKNSKQRLRCESKDLLDLIEMCLQDLNKKDPFLRFVALPLTAMMFTEKDAELASSEKNIIVLIDATGTIARTPQYVPIKRIYYYTIVMRHKLEILTLCHMITSEHDIPSINRWLTTYKFFAMKIISGWPFIRAAVSDWSWVFFHGVMESWNSMNLKQYNDIMFEYATKNIDPPNDIVFLKVCCSHFMNLVSRSIKANFAKFVHSRTLKDDDKKEVKNVLLDCMGLLLLCRDIAQVDQVFSVMCNILLTPDDEEAKKYLKVIASFVKKQAKHINEQKQDIMDDENDEGFENKPTDAIHANVMYEDSLFHSRYLEKYTDIKEKIEKKHFDSEILNKPTNIYYAPSFVRYLVRTWMPYIHLWSAIGMDLIDPNISRLSNAYVESETKVTKRKLDNHANSSVADVIRKLEREQKEKAALIDMDIALKKSKAAILKPKYPKHKSNPDLGEIWDPKTSADYTINDDVSSTSHLDAKTIKKIVKKMNAKGDEDGNPIQKATSQKVKGKLRSEEEGTVTNDKKKLKTVSKPRRKRKRHVLDNDTSNKKSKKKFAEKKDEVSMIKKSSKKKLKLDLLSDAPENTIKIMENSSVVDTKVEVTENSLHSNEGVELTNVQMHTGVNNSTDKLNDSYDSIDQELDVIELSSQNEVREKILNVTSLEKNHHNDKIKILQINIEKLHNGVIKNENYYWKSRSSNTFVCKFDTPNFISTKICSVTAREFATTKSNVWINGLIIDAYVTMRIANWVDVTYVTTDDSSMIVGEFSEKRISKERKICKAKFTLKSRIMIPYMYMSHWRLLIVDTNEKEIGVLDPYGSLGDEDRAIKAFENFVQYSDSEFSVLKNTVWKKLKIADRPHQRQNDGHSCGIWVMHYADCVGSKRPFDKEFDVVQYRKKVVEDLLLLSNDLNNHCLNCGSAVKSSSVGCHGCLRICHESCEFYNEVDTDEEEKNYDRVGRKKRVPKIKLSSKIQKNESKFLCKLCQQYFSDAQSSLLPQEHVQ